MQLELHPDFQVQKLTVGNENVPVLIIDNFIADAEQLIEDAATKKYEDGGGVFPGVRAKAPMPYMALVYNTLTDAIRDCFQLKGTKLSFWLCRYSLVTTPREQLTLPQRVPHFDSADSVGLASIYYLFHKGFGGTSFYRHRATGYEYIDEGRHRQYLQTLEEQSRQPGFPGCDYINGDTPFFERTAAHEGIFNRMLVYRRNTLHSGSIDENFVPDANPLTGRLSINSFLDVH